MNCVCYERKTVTMEVNECMKRGDQVHLLVLCECDDVFEVKKILTRIKLSSVSLKKQYR